MGLCAIPLGFQQWILTEPKTANSETPEQNFQLCTLVRMTMGHHEQEPSHQERFQKLTDVLYQLITRVGNPFEEQYLELLIIKILDCASQGGVENLCKLKEIGITLSQQYVRNVIETESQSIHKYIPKNSLFIFRETKGILPKQRHKLTTTMTLKF